MSHFNNDGNTMDIIGTNSWGEHWWSNESFEAMLKSDKEYNRFFGKRSTFGRETIVLQFSKLY